MILKETTELTAEQKITALVFMKNFLLRFTCNGCPFAEESLSNCNKCATVLGWVREQEEKLGSR